MSNIDLRVGEVFESELHYESEPFNDTFRFVIFQNGKAEAATWFEDQAEAICIAVNQHSKLTTITKQRDELVKLFEGLERVTDIWLPSHVDNEHIGEAECLHRFRNEYLALLSEIDKQKSSN